VFLTKANLTLKVVFNSPNELFGIKNSFLGRIPLNLDVNVIITNFSVFLLGGKNFCKVLFDFSGLDKMQTEHSTDSVVRFGFDTNSNQCSFGGVQNCIISP